MSLSSSNRHSLRTALMTALVITAGACSDQPITSSATPVLPPTPTANQAGMLRGTVREDGTIVLESLDPAIVVGDSNTSGAIYGNQNVTAKVTTSNFSLTNAGGVKTWKFTLAVHNLLNYPVGVIDGATTTPLDTVGVFVFFPTAPSVVSPANSGASVSVLNTQGTASFSGINQKYYWYHDRLSAKGLAGDSTKNNPTWTFSAPSTVNSFRFSVLLSAPWPRGMQTQDTSWAVAYNPASDSLPDVSASPRWKRIGIGYGGTETASSSVGLTMTVNPQAHGNYDDMFFYRSDNLNRNDNAYIEARLKLTSGGGGNPVMILALADSVKFVGLGIGNGKIGMATFNFTTFQWEWLAGGTISVSTTSVHTYRVGKFGSTTSTVYVDGVERFSSANVLLPANFLPQYAQFVGGQAAHLSTFFGPTAQDAGAVAVVSYVNYAFHATPKP